MTETTSEVVELAFTCVRGEKMEIGTAFAEFGGDGVPALRAEAVDGAGEEELLPRAP